MKRILVTGAAGQIGQELWSLLQKLPTADLVVGADISFGDVQVEDPHATFDIRDRNALEQVLRHYEIDTVYHLASLLSARGEDRPDMTWEVNLGGLKNILDLAKNHQCRVFWPSSIAVFGADTPRLNTPQSTIMEPATMYGITKLAGENLCRYYHQRFGVDVRSVRFPGLISYAAPPGGGTTDYAVEMLQAAALGTEYASFLQPATRLPMMYMPDALNAILTLMQAPNERLTVRSSYNLTAFSFSGEELLLEIQKHQPAFSCTFVPDYRQAIADSWPMSIDDSQARKDWNWKPAYTMKLMVEDMLEKLHANMEQPPN